MYASYPSTSSQPILIFFFFRLHRFRSRDEVDSGSASRDRFQRHVRLSSLPSVSTAHRESIFTDCQSPTISTLVWTRSIPPSSPQLHVRLSLPHLITTFLTQFISEGVKVHGGFQDAFLRTAPGILSGVKSALDSTGFTNVLVTGHSLGAALATMDTLMLKMALPQEISLSGRVFGLPRGGNQAYADLIDSMVRVLQYLTLVLYLIQLRTQLGDSFQFVTNQNDPVPTVPPRFLDFQHSKGETHILSTSDVGDPTKIVSCTGQENVACAEGNSLLKASVENHQGERRLMDDLGKFWILIILRFRTVFT